jgi:hypothetical protein
MGLFGNNDAHVVKSADEKTREQDTRPFMHGSRGEWNLMSGMGSATNWGLRWSEHKNIRPTGESPTGKNNRP